MVVEEWRGLARRCTADLGVVGALARALTAACDLLEAPRVWLDVGDQVSPRGMRPAMRCPVHGVTFIGEDGLCHHGTGVPGNCSLELEPNPGSVTRLVDRLTGEVDELGQVAYLSGDSVYVSVVAVVARARKFMEDRYTMEIEVDPTGIGQQIVEWLQQEGCHVVTRRKMASASR